MPLTSLGFQWVSPPRLAGRVRFDQVNQRVLLLNLDLHGQNARTVSIWVSVCSDGLVVRYAPPWPSAQQNKLVRQVFPNGNIGIEEGLRFVCTRSSDVFGFDPRSPIAENSSHPSSLSICSSTALPGPRQSVSARTRQSSGDKPNRFCSSPPVPAWRRDRVFAKATPRQCACDAATDQAAAADVARSKGLSTPSVRHRQRIKAGAHKLHRNAVSKLQKPRQKTRSTNSNGGALTLCVPPARQAATDPTQKKQRGQKGLKQQQRAPRGPDVKDVFLPAATACFGSNHSDVEPIAAPSTKAAPFAAPPVRLAGVADAARLVAMFAECHAGQRAARCEETATAQCAISGRRLRRVRRLARLDLLRFQSALLASLPVRRRGCLGKPWVDGPAV